MLTSRRIPHILESLHNLLKMSSKITNPAKCKVRAQWQKTILLRGYQNVGDELLQFIVTGEDMRIVLKC